VQAIPSIEGPIIKKASGINKNNHFESLIDLFIFFHYKIFKRKINFIAWGSPQTSVFNLPDGLRAVYFWDQQRS